MKKTIVIALLFSSAQAVASYQCVVDVNRVLVYGDGTVNVLHTGRDDYTHICNLQQERQGVSITTCAMWTSLLQNTQNNGVRALFQYPGTGSCETLPTYASSPVPSYIGTIK